MYRPIQRVVDVITYTFNVGEIWYAWSSESIDCGKRDKEGERERARAREREGERDEEREREKERERESVCVCERERERERVIGRETSRIGLIHWWVVWHIWMRRVTQTQFIHRYIDTCNIHKYMNIMWHSRISRVKRSQCIHIYTQYTHIHTHKFMHTNTYTHTHTHCLLAHHSAGYIFAMWLLWAQDN